MWFRASFVSANFVATLLVLPLSVVADGRPLAGWVEKVVIAPGNIVLNAKLDTGADSSSLHASQIEEFRKGSERWVRFELSARDGAKKSLERRVVREALIKRQGEKGQRRQVIKLGICLGTAYMETDINLVDRSNYEYQMLVGRNFLAGNVNINPAVTYSIEPNCAEIKGSQK